MSHGLDAVVATMDMDMTLYCHVTLHNKGIVVVVVSIVVMLWRSFSTEYICHICVYIIRKISFP